ncbi:MAG: MarC family protein [bacterium]
MTEIAIVAIATFLATIGPIDLAVVFAALTTHLNPANKRRAALKGVLIAASILLIFALGGNTVLSAMGISLAALSTGGGILLLLIGINMVMARSSGATSATDEEQLEAHSRRDISIFPLATPLIAGPGAMNATILLMAGQSGNVVGQLTVLAALLAVLLLTLIALFFASNIQRLLGITGIHVIARVMGVLLTALAVQFIFDGISESGLLQ